MEYDWRIVCAHGTSISGGGTSTSTSSVITVSTIEHYAAPISNAHVVISGMLYIMVLAGEIPTMKIATETVVTTGQIPV